MQCVIPYPCEPSRLFIAFYETNLPWTLMVFCFSMAGLLFTIKSFIVIKLYENVISTKVFTEWAVKKRRKNPAADPFDDLRKMSRKLWCSIVVCLACSAAIPIASAWQTNIAFCIAMIALGGSVFAFLYGVFLMMIGFKVMLDWLNEETLVTIDKCIEEQDKKNKEEMEMATQRALESSQGMFPGGPLPLSDPEGSKPVAAEPERETEPSRPATARGKRKSKRSKS